MRRESFVISSGFIIETRRCVWLMKLNDGIRDNGRGCGAGGGSGRSYWCDVTRLDYISRLEIRHQSSGLISSDAKCGAILNEHFGDWYVSTNGLLIHLIHDLNLYSSKWFETDFQKFYVPINYFKNITKQLHSISNFCDFVKFELCIVCKN